LLGSGAMAPPSHAMVPRPLRLGLAPLAAACGVGTSSGADFGDGDGDGNGGATSASTVQTPGSTVAATTNDEAETVADDDGPLLDVANTDDVGPSHPVDGCKVTDDMNAIGECGRAAPPDSFDPEIQWTWADLEQSTVTPLVANLTDDNGDGAIDLCDIPDVIVVAWSGDYVTGSATIVVLDGATGTEHFRIDYSVPNLFTPAIGDIDGDGLPEIVTLNAEHSDRKLVAFEHDGTLAWERPHSMSATALYGAIALADLDEDGDVEIIANDLIADHEGFELWRTPQVAGDYPAPTAANLDDEPGMEVVVGHAAYHADGSEYYLNAGITPGFPQIGDLDDDPQPEVIVSNTDGFSVLEHDGTTKYADLRPTGQPAQWLNWVRPVTIHDFDGDGAAEFAMSSGSQYSAFEADGTLLWSANVLDDSGIAGGTAFDFLGDGIAEAMYADETTLFVFDGAGVPVLEVPRSSRTVIEYPVVADIDNDGSAEIVVVSAQRPDVPLSPTVQVIRDRDDRWIQARRIWNQHTYHVTNVREDGTIPIVEPRSWELLNTFRTNSQIEGGALCMPNPAG
jgi:hypothetical protein